ncbi:MAG: prolipoprotein diacylglyceryl transferase family protein [Solirubrobacteraceae bacterium]
MRPPWDWRSGYAVGRVGDLIAGEHYGQVSHLPWAIAYTYAGAGVPRLGLPYQPGALYEIVLELAIFRGAVVAAAAAGADDGRVVVPGAVLAGSVCDVLLPQRQPGLGARSPDRAMGEPRLLATGLLGRQPDASRRVEPAVDA